MIDKSDEVIEVNAPFDVFFFFSLTDWDMLPWSLKNVKCNSKENKSTSNTWIHKVNSSHIGGEQSLRAGHQASGV